MVKRHNIAAAINKSIRVVLISMLLLPFIVQREANACLSCNLAVNITESFIWDDAKDQFDEKINDEFLRLERFMVLNMWRDSILPVLMLAAEQFTAVAMQQVMIIGMFLDAKIQMETQQLLQTLQAQAHKDYHPSEGMCVFGTAMKGLAASEMRGDLTAFILSQRSMDRQLGSIQSSGAYGNDLDKQYRILHFKEKYCNEKDRSAALGGRLAPSALASLCPNMAWATMAPEKRLQMDKDIDFFRTLDSPWTLRVNFTNQTILDTAATPQIHNEEEEDVFALASNLFASELFARPPSKSLEHIPARQLTNMQQAFMDMRAIVAKRSVAESSYNAVVGLKSEGTMATDFEGNPVNDAGGNPSPMRSRPYLVNIMQNLGVSSADALRLVGDNPSYNAQMEILTKKIFQSPDFYTNLYDKPANIKRKQVTLQSIKMMQKFDMLKSFLREEATFSILLELAVIDLQREIEGQINKIDVSERRG
jgi:hypothetical protein